MLVRNYDNSTYGRVISVTDTELEITASRPIEGATKTEQSPPQEVEVELDGWDSLTLRGLVFTRTVSDVDPNWLLLEDAVNAELANDPTWLDDIPAPEPQPVVPSEVTPAQIRKWLIRQGILLSSVDDFIEAIEDPIQRQDAFIDWNRSITVLRTNPFVIGFATAMGMTREQIDAAFIAASQL